MTDIKITPTHFKKITGVEFDKIGKKFPDLLDDDGNMKEDADIGTAVVALVAEKASAQHSRGKREALEGIEQELTAIGITDVQNAKEGLQTLAQRMKGEPGKDPNPATLTEEQVTKLPIFSTALENKVKALREAKEAIESEFSTYKQTVEGERKNTGRKAVFLAELRKLNANFGTKGEDQAIAAFLALHPDKHVNDQGLIVDDKGEPIQDAQFNTQSVTDFLKDTWFLGMNAAPNNPAPPPPAGKTEQGAGSYLITSNEQYNEMIQRPNLTQAEKSGIRQGYAEFLEKQK
jgi:hypothetical protein